MTDEGQTMDILIIPRCTPVRLASKVDPFRGNQKPMRVVNTMTTVPNTGTEDTAQPTRVIIPDKDDTTWDYSPPTPSRYGPRIILK